jgi:orotidine-5'-phosphate decarboxylase
MDRVLVALDVATARDALALADELRDVVGGFKIGSQLFTSTGPGVVRTLVDRGDQVFLDLKFHDIPHTVAAAVTAAAELGVWMVNVHAAGGPAMLAAARDAADRTAAARGIRRPLVVAVTVLTSLDGDTLRAIGTAADPEDQVLRLARLAQSSGLDGVVASPQEVGAIREACGRDFVVVTPGIRSADGGGDDQRRTATAAGALAAGSSYLVIGRPITATSHPRAAAERIAREIARAQAVLPR